MNYSPVKGRNALVVCPVYNFLQSLDSNALFRGESVMSIHIKNSLIVHVDINYF